MEQLDTRFPGFGFAIHKGYPTRSILPRCGKWARRRYTAGHSDR